MSEHLKSLIILCCEALFGLVYMYNVMSVKPLVLVCPSIFWFSLHCWACYVFLWMASWRAYLYILGDNLGYLDQGVATCYI